MSVTLREADLESEHDALLAVLERNLPALPHAERFKWLYRENPAGRARAWFVCDRASGRVVGSTSLFPRALWIGDAVHLAGQVGDFAVDATHRSLGPALMLQRATFRPVDEGDLLLSFDCPPDERGMATFRRLGLGAAFQMVRYARVLRVDRLIGRHVNARWLAAPVTAAGNLMLRRRRHWRTPPAGLEIVSHSGRFGDEFSELDRRVAGCLGIRGRRSVAELNWRFRDNPLGDYRVIAARRRNELIGYCVYQVAAEDASIVDVFGVLARDGMVALLDGVAESLAQTPVQTLQAAVAPHPELVDALTCAGFWRRSSGPHVVPYARASTAGAWSDSPWRFTNADVAA